MSPTKAPKKAVRLDTVFMTGPGGTVYEVPRNVAAKYAITMERVGELGHLPVTPYGTTAPTTSAPAGGSEGGEGDVEGRHLAWNPTYGWVWHSNYLYGTFLWVDGYYYSGEHYHPYGTELGYI